MRLAVPACTVALLAAASSAQSFADFESPQTHPIAISTDGARLFVLDTPAHSLSVFSLADPDRPVLRQRIAVGLEPVSVAPRTDDEVWVVDWLSDSISVVSLQRACTVATIHVGDEPADVVFAGTPQRAFVSVAGRDEVCVLDPITRTEVARVPIFGDEPRALAVADGGRQVLVAVHRSGNGTTIVPDDLAPPPPPPRDGLPPAPRQGIIVRADDPAWQRLGVHLPDLDVFEIDADTPAVVRTWREVGTMLFGIAVDPRTGDAWVAHTQARNLVRFAPALHGHVVDNRVTRLVRTAAEPSLQVHDLDAEIDQDALPTAASLSLALAQPTDLRFAPDGSVLYVAAMGSDRIAVLGRDGAVQARIELTPGDERGDPRRLRGPRGLVPHPSRPRLYVSNRVSHTLEVVDTEGQRVLHEQPLGNDPTPPAVAAGRGFLYAASLSRHGTTSCASCHVDGDFDGLAWDLGNPDGDLQRVDDADIVDLTLHPMKGPMTTQTLRGLTADTAPFHHRGDHATLMDFDEAFQSLLGGERLGARDMRTFVGFLETLAFPPNPNRTLDDRVPDGPRPDGVPDGATLFTTGFNGPLRCIDCHRLPTGTNGIIVPGLFQQVQPQPMVVPQLRDVYKRTARMAQGGLRRGGFGLAHDGSADSVADFLRRPFFRALSHHADARAELERFLLAFDTGTAPAVGWARTVTATQPLDEAGAAQLGVVEHAAASGRCDLVVEGRLRGETVRLRFEPERNAYAAAGESPPMALPELLDVLIAGDAITFLGLPGRAPRRAAGDDAPTTR